MSVTPRCLPPPSSHGRCLFSRLPVEVSRTPITENFRSLTPSIPPSSYSTEYSYSRCRNTFHVPASIFMKFSSNLHPHFALGTSSGDSIGTLPQIATGTLFPQRCYTRYARRRLRRLCSDCPGSSHGENLRPVILLSNYLLQISRGGYSETSNLECDAGYRSHGLRKTSPFPFSDTCSVYTIRGV